jgi:phosphatidylinositol kinase/protein kinase (PI-3  family)
VVTYLLQIKDRHNGNILLDRDGHLIHIDFGFMLSNSPGNIGFEAAPFKLPLEYVEVLGGADGEPLREFRKLFHEGFEAARKHCDRIVTMVELMQKGTARLIDPRNTMLTKERRKTPPSLVSRRPGNRLRRSCESAFSKRSHIRLWWNTLTSSLTRHLARHGRACMIQ